MTEHASSTLELPFGADVLHQAPATGEADPLRCAVVLGSGATDDAQTDLKMPPVIIIEEGEPPQNTLKPFGAELFRNVSDRAALGILACVYGLNTTVDDAGTSSQVDDRVYSPSEIMLYA